MIAGSATRIINCQIGDDLAGQLHRRFCTRIRDDLEANFFYLSDGEESVLLVNLDLAGLFEWSCAREMTAAMSASSGVADRNIIITSTHTHAAPDTLGLLFDSPKNEMYVAALKDWLADGASEAVANARPARVGWGMGEAHVGFNRRLCWADGTHSMYGDSTRPDFIGLEGPDDPSHSVLFAGDGAGPIAILQANCCHSTCVESSDFASADFPGEARRLLREELQQDVPVLYLQGASGDISPRDMMRPPAPYDGEARMREIGPLMATETRRLMDAAELVDDPILRHVHDDISVDVRLPTEEAVRHAEAMEAAGEESAPRGEYILQVSGALRLHRAFNDDPVDTLAIHALRIGDLGIVTNPCELYCQFGLDIKRRSPAPLTMVGQLADGFSGYCPTTGALMGGGYSADPTYWARLETAAGDRIVDASSRLLHQLWAEE
ncbi:MAG TPA: hypothetical protein QGH10_27165 [Armatimonadota bacterium]|nr:hypothetical protein [Armatimonadota bacterium]